MAANQNSELTVIGQGTTIRGEVDFEQGARILGVFEGKIRSQGEVQIGDSADCRAEIIAERVVVDGSLEGDITARDTLTLSASARMSGDIRATRLHVDEGATFEGHVSVGESALATASKPAQRPAQQPSQQAAQQTAPATPRPATSGQNGAPAAAASGNGDSGVPSPASLTGREIDFKPPWRDAAAKTADADSTPAKAESGAA